MNVLLDAGALIGFDRGDARVGRRLEVALHDGTEMTSHGGVIGQAWRGDPRQARLARLINGIHVVGLDEQLGRAAGVLLARTRGGADVIDAALVALAREGDTILTSDVDDIARLARAAPVDVSIVRV